MSQALTSAARAAAASTHDEATVFTNADTAGGKPMTADDQTEIDFWTAALEEHSNRAMLNISRQALAKLLGIIGKLRTEQRAESIREMQAVNSQRSVRWMAGSPGWTTLEIAGELAGEVGELANVCKKLRRSEMGVPGNKVSDEELLRQARGEMADVMIVLMLTASKLGIDLQDAVRDTFNAKSEQMGFPERLGSALAHRCVAPGNCGYVLCPMIPQSDGGSGPNA
jgi:NTP pyrophosphatase (non-canonical NTP hydrolase)